VIRTRKTPLPPCYNIPDTIDPQGPECMFLIIIVFVNKFNFLFFFQLVNDVQNEINNDEDDNTAHG